MKKLLTLVTLLAASVTISSAQQLVVKTYVESTSISPKLGTAIGRTTKLGFEYGGFYQEASALQQAPIGDEPSEMPRFFEKEFFGFYGSAPLVTGRTLGVKLNVRTGLSNRENFSITPSVLGSVSATNRIKFGVGLGVRSFRPTYQGSVAIVL